MLGHTLIKYLQNQNSLEVEFTVRDKTKQKDKKIFGKEANFLFDADRPESALDAISTFQTKYLHKLFRAYKTER